MTKKSSDFPMIIGVCKRKRMKKALLVMVCSAVTIVHSAGGVLAQSGAARVNAAGSDQAVRQVRTVKPKYAGSLDANGQQSAGSGQPAGSQTMDGQQPADSGQNVDGQQPADSDQNAGGQIPEENQSAPSGQPAGSQPPDGQQPADSGQSTEEQPSGDNNQIPDGQPVDERPEDTIKITASVSLDKSGTAAKVSWKKSGEGNVSSYLVQRSSRRDGDYKTIARQKTGKSYIDQKVTSASRYYYRVAAKTEGGEISYSKICSFLCPVEPLPEVKLVRYSTSSIKVMWDKSKDKQAVWYKVYYATSRSGKYKLAGVTKNTWYRVTNLKKDQDYYFGVKACATKKESGSDSKLSKIAKMRTKPYERTTIFAGDSITTGLTAYRVLDEIAIGGKKSVVAAIGLNTMTFRTRKVFNGKSAVEAIVAAKPYRVYIMLGDNDIHFRNKNDLIDGYKEIVRSIKAGTPNTDIVILAASPVTAAEVSRRRGFAQIPAYNQALSALAAEMGVKYYDCTGFLKDSTGWLKSSYNAGDGVHWKSAAYHEYAKRLTAYDKSLD
ncbi:MAG: fibronectin type III domain-containing protein [Eubacterium sp.]|nr:fibronectin type III domain-containing protein [Eubacterium sp.]